MLTRFWHMSLGREDRLARLLHSHVTSATDGLSTFKLALENGSHSLTWVVSKQPADQGVRTREFVHYAQECCECVKVLHDMNLVHGDINPANFILVKFSKSQTVYLITIQVSKSFFVRF